MGLNNLDHPGVHSQSRGVRSIIVHPRYNRAVVDYDISVVQLDSEVSKYRYRVLIMSGGRPVLNRYFVVFAGGGDTVCQTSVSASTRPASLS